MTPLSKKTLFRMRKLKHPLKPNKKGRKITFAKGFKRGSLTALLILLTIAVIHIGKIPLKTTNDEGGIAREDTYAPFNFTYKSGIDEDKTNLKRQEFVSKILSIYTVNDEPYNSAISYAGRFFNEIIKLKETGADASEEQIRAIKADVTIGLEADKVMTILKYADIKKLKDTTLLMLDGVYSRPIITDEGKKLLLASSQQSGIICQAASGEKITRKPEEVRSITECHEYVDSLLLKTEIEDSVIIAILRQIMNTLVRPNLIYDEQASETAKKQAADSVLPEPKISESFKGEIIVRKGQRFTKEQISQLDAIIALSAKDTITSQFWGIVIIICILAFVMYIYIKLFESKIFQQDKLLLLICLMVLLIAVAARIITSLQISSYFIPIAAASMLLAILVNGTVAAITTMAAAIVVALISGARFDIFLVSIVGGISAICTVYGARNRSQVMKSGLYVGILSAITISAIGIFNNIQFPIFLLQSLWGIGSGLLSAGLTMTFLPLFEYTFKLTTDIKLVELADLNHPILKEMVMKAAGTYHHSLVVGNLAEAASNMVGANPLLARVGSYYHDIGKIQKADYFIENKQNMEQAHDNLEPTMSSLIITNHVKDGIELAERYKLGNAIKDIIEQHHGTGLVTYFYHQAIEKVQQLAESSQQGEQVSEESFRYPGPKPQTKEAAIVMLADSVEAASRVLQSPTPQRLKELVRKIINNKIIDDQLDECDLTLKDLNKIAGCFVRILTGIYHSRIEYPDQAPATRYANNINKRPNREKSQ